MCEDLFSNVGVPVAERSAVAMVIGLPVAEEKRSAVALVKCLAVESSVVVADSLS